MPRSTGRTVPPGKRRRASQAARRSGAPPVDPNAVLGAASVLSLVDKEEDIARLSADAVASAVSAPLGAVVLRDEGQPEGRVYGQLSNTPLDTALADEVRTLVTKCEDADGGLSGGSSVEVKVREANLPHAAQAGLGRLLVARLGAGDATFGAVVAGKASGAAYAQAQRRAVETLASQASMALNRVRLSERLARQARDLSILNAVAVTANRSLDTREVLDATLKTVLELTEMDAGAVFTVDEQGEAMKIASSSLPGAVLESVEAACHQGQMRAGVGVPGQTLASGQAAVVLDVQNDEREVGSPIRAGGFRSHLCIPLRARGRVYGVLGLLSYSRSEFSAADVQLYQSIANFMAMAEANARAYQQSREQAMIEERNRLAREIHDTLAQSLIGIIVKLEAAEELAEREPEVARAEARAARDLARQSLEEARRSVWNLRPSALGSGTLAKALQREVERARSEGLQASLAVEGAEPESLDSRTELAALRIAQEALANVLRHAQATAVQFNIVFGAADARLRVSDNGAGFDPSAARGMLSPAGGGFGLVSMQERARLVGGYAEVRSAPGMGTQIEAVIPYHSDPQEAPSLTSTSTTANIPTQAASESIRVLVVDDHEVVRKGIRSMLERADGLLVVGEAADGESAIEEIRRLAPDIVLLDVQMPKLDGVETLKRLRALGLKTRAILLSVYAKDEQVFEGLRAGAQGYLTKDVRREDLTHAIRTVHEGGSLLQPVMAHRLIERLEDSGGDRLTDRELEVLQLLASGARNKEIAARMYLSIGTVKFHIANIYQKLKVQTRTEAIRVASERGILTA